MNDNVKSQPLTIIVEGMNCASCSARVEQAALAVPGVLGAKVNLTAKSLSLELEEEGMPMDLIFQAITQAGYQPRNPKNLIRLSYQVEGMNCGSCQSKVAAAIQSLPGIERFTVNLMTKRLNLDYNPENLTPSQVEEAVTKAGYQISAPKQEELREMMLPGFAKEFAQYRTKVKAAFLFVLPLLIVAMGPMLGLKLPGFIHPDQNPMSYAILQLVLLFPLIWVGRDFYLQGIPHLLRGGPNMDSLIAMGTASATIFSLYHSLLIYQGQAAYAHQLYYETAGVIIALILFGRLLESLSKEKSFNALRELLALQSDEARILREGEELIIPQIEVIEGDLLLVKAGEIIPVDGTIQKGKGSVNEAMITGESLPLAKEKGSEVIGGCVVAEGLFEIEATHVGRDSTLAKMIQLVEEAQASKAPIARKADIVAGYFVPAVMVIALISGVSWALLGAGAVFSVKIFISVMVIACPCALGLATPTAILVGTSRGAKLGILIKGGESLERLSEVDAILFDKTGTLTLGEPEVLAIHCEGEINKQELLGWAANLELGSEHLLAQAIVEHAQEQGLELERADETEILAGQGVLANFRGRKLILGNEDLMVERGIFQNPPPLAQEELSQGHILVYLASEGQLLGYLSLRDQPRPEAAEAIQRLKGLGLIPYMLTGDKAEAAKEVAGEIGISEVFSSVKPAQKLEKINELQAQGLKVAMVGDGINDAPALAKADVGIALGSGTEVSMESASMVLLEDNLLALVRGLRLSRATLTNIKQNLFWAFGYNILGIPLAAGVFYHSFALTLNPMIAALAMAFSSVSVVTNALRLNRFR